MAKIGSALALLLAAAPAGAVEFYQQVDRTQVGTEDTFRLTVVMADAPDDAKVQFPQSPDFEVLSNAQSTQMSYTLGSGGVGTIKRVQRWTLTMRANRTGNVTIPPSQLTAGGKVQKTEAIKMEVVKGRSGGSQQPQAQRPTIQTPFGPMPAFPPGFGDDDPFNGFPTPDVPRSDSDLFLRSSLDKEEAFVGEQVMFTLVLFSRVDAANVDNVNLPRLDGVWVEDLDSPTRLVPEHREINGIPYRAYVVMRRALFAMKPGNVQITAAEADITTGYLFNGHRVHRRSNPQSLKVKPLPPGGPPGMKVSMVGKWRLSAEASQTKVALGEPVQVKVTLEGKGNLKDAVVPALKGPNGVKVYDPTTTDKMSVNKTTVQGKRVVEYVVLPQQTGRFTLPGLSIWYFDPEKRAYEEAKTDPIELTVGAGQGSSNAIATNNGSNAAIDPTTKNRLEAGGLKPLRHTGQFVAPKKPLHQVPWFLALALMPLGLTLAMGLVGASKKVLGTASPEAHRRQKSKEARRRLAAAEKILSTAKPNDFYSEVEKAVTGFLDARLQLSSAGLTRDQLEAKLAASTCPPEVRPKVRAVLDTCDMGRFAPGMGEAAARRKALDDAAEMMGAWEA
jgi:hypothetical protein